MTIELKAKNKGIFLDLTNKSGIMARPAWTLMSTKMYDNCVRDELTNSIWLENRIIIIPSSIQL